jgi:hypothetical protein
MLIGGSGALTGDVATDALVAATANTEQLDLGATTPAWASRSSMAYRRVLNTAILWPDGKVFVMGGSRSGRSDHGNDPVMTPELYNPSNNTFKALCPMRVPRVYHSTALLLPDGRVLTAGRDHEFNDPPYNWPERRIEIYSPPYLTGEQTRPAITAAPASAFLNTNFTVTLSTAVAPTNISRAVLMSPASVTHGLDMGQRAIQLVIVSSSGSNLTLKGPPDSKVAPPGYYMLFLLTSQGVPSVAKFIQFL